MSCVQVSVIGWAVALLIFAAYIAYCVVTLRRHSREAVLRMVSAAHQVGVEDGRRERDSVGICGDQLDVPWGNSNRPGPFGVLWCDLPAGHAGWHGCLVPGSPERTSWTHGEEQT